MLPAQIFYNTEYFTSTERTLIFLHGFGGDHTAWNIEQKQLFNLGYSSIAIDLRGHGKSTRQNELAFYKIENFAQDVFEIIKKENIKNPIIIGHCFGGMVGIVFENLYPKVASALVLVDTSYKPPFFTDVFVHLPFAYKIFALIAERVPNLYIQSPVDFNKFIGTSDLDIKRIASDMLHTSLRSYLIIADQLLKFNGFELLNNINIPTLVVCGTKDIIFPPSIAKRLSGRIKNSQLDLVQGANHIIVLNNPNELTQEITKFIQAL